MGAQTDMQRLLDRVLTPVRAVTREFEQILAQAELAALHDSARERPEPLLATTAPIEIAPTDPPSLRSNSRMHSAASGARALASRQDGSRSPEPRAPLPASPRSSAALPDGRPALLPQEHENLHAPQRTASLSAHATPSRSSAALPDGAPALLPQGHEALHAPERTAPQSAHAARAAAYTQESAARPLPEATSVSPRSSGAQPHVDGPHSDDEAQSARDPSVVTSTARAPQTSALPPITLRRSMESVRVPHAPRSEKPGAESERTPLPDRPRIRIHPAPGATRRGHLVFAPTEPSPPPEREAGAAAATVGSAPPRPVLQVPHESVRPGSLSAPASPPNASSRSQRDTGANAAAGARSAVSGMQRESEPAAAISGTLAAAGQDRIPATPGHAAPPAITPPPATEPPAAPDLQGIHDALLQILQDAARRQGLDP